MRTIHKQRAKSVNLPLYCKLGQLQMSRLQTNLVSLGNLHILQKNQKYVIKGCILGKLAFIVTETTLNKSYDISKVWQLNKI